MLDRVFWSGILGTFKLYPGGLRQWLFLFLTIEYLRMESVTRKGRGLDISLNNSMRFFVYRRRIMKENRKEETGAVENRTLEMLKTGAEKPGEFDIEEPRDCAKIT